MIAINEFALLALPVFAGIAAKCFPQIVFLEPPSSLDGDALLAHCKKLGERGFLAATIVVSVVFGLCIPTISGGMVRISYNNPLDTPAQRLAYSFMLDVFTACFYVIAILNVAMSRSQDPTAVSGERQGIGLRVEMASRKLQNTTEQLFLNVLSRSVLAVVITAEDAALLPASVALFLSGRVFFFAGYSTTNPMGREFGFDLTLMSSLACLVYAIMKIPAFFN